MYFIGVHWHWRWPSGRGAQKKLRKTGRLLGTRCLFGANFGVGGAGTDSSFQIAIIAHSNVMDSGSCGSGCVCECVLCLDKMCVTCVEAKECALSIAWVVHIVQYTVDYHFESPLYGRISHTFCYFAIYFKSTHTLARSLHSGDMQFSSKIMCSLLT